MKRTLICFLCGFCLIAISSCKDNYTICDQSKNVFFKAGFYSAANGAATAVPGLTLSVLGNNNIYSNQANLTNFVLSLNPAVDSAVYFIRLSNSLPADTLTLVYSTQTMLISQDCGSVYINTLTKAYATSNTIDSVKISNATVDLTGNENLKIYY